MVEIIITFIIVMAAIFIIFKSVSNSKGGKCSCGCNKCSSRNICTKKDNN